MMIEISNIRQCWWTLGLVWIRNELLVLSFNFVTIVKPRFGKKKCRLHAPCRYELWNPMHRIVFVAVHNASCVYVVVQSRLVFYFVCSECFIRLFVECSKKKTLLCTFYLSSYTISTWIWMWKWIGFFQHFFDLKRNWMMMFNFVDKFDWIVTWHRQNKFSIFLNERPRASF